MALPDQATCATGTFPTTHWSAVLAAGQSESPQAEAALEQLCRASWYPLYAFARRVGHAPADAQDLTQGFFAHTVANPAEVEEELRHLVAVLRG